MSTPDGSGLGPVPGLQTPVVASQAPIQVDIQAQIDAAVKAALEARDAAAIEAAKPKVLTPREEVVDRLDRAQSALTQDRVSTHDAALFLVDAVRRLLDLSVPGGN